MRARWAWAEHTVWTERMLTALERGIKGGVWFSLIDKVYGLPNLWSAFAKVKANRGCKDALRRVDAQLESGHTHVVDADLKSYFDTIPHEPLMRRMRENRTSGSEGGESGK